ncbi:non-ribosomal peptide synthetase [Streptomyces sp. NBC_00338]|uniref:non-ribosomal peptide synthetase n=1 Tax=Streptomyces sp. NBC_00338 TaxID=2975715 RepID=UPI0022569CC1|nr:non-ribosomal peptide synthetase [Streptomyces sp. NBC_00338]MCX5141805.1 amino acid adenylation domain-containing protein [Streptomyces sp. NBC_00338]
MTNPASNRAAATPDASARPGGGSPGTDAAGGGVPPGYFHELVAAAARRAPRATAVDDGAVRLGYGELDAAANRLAQHLLGFGAGPGARVALLMERGTYSVLSQLAVLRTGAACVLLDPKYPPERLRYMLSDARPVATLTVSELRGELPPEAVVIEVDAADARWRDAPDEDPCAAVEDDSVCHIAYTSGSTGTPKAAQLRHGALRNLLHVLREECGITPASRGSWLCSPGFGLVEVDFFPLLAAGGSVHIPDRATASDPEALRDWTVERRLTHSLWLTAMAERLWRLDWPAGTALTDVRIAGERARSWPPGDLPFRILNVYGSAEATVATVCDLTGLARTLTDDERERRGVPIGRPVSNVRAYVMDGQRQPVSGTDVGELYLSGASLSLGYLNRPETTAGTFLPNTVPDDPYPVLYRTGDLARRCADGSLEVVGRTDDQVKIAGYRVQLGELESALAGCPGVRRAAVTARQDEAEGSTRLIAYVEPDPACPPTLTELRGRLRRILPAYMAPSAYVFVPDMPITANGKIDKAALPEPPRTRPELESPYQAPRNLGELALTALWEEALGLTGIGVFDDFFDLGGDSLRAMRLVALITERTGRRTTMSDLYRAPTPVALADVLAHAGPDTAATDDGPETVISAAPQAGHLPFPLTESQQALWIGRGDAVDYGNVGCHGYFEWQNPDLDVDRFRAAWARLVERHAMLRVSIAPDGTQRIAERLPHDGVLVVDLRDLAPDEAEAEAVRIRERMSHQVLPVEQPPLYDVRLTRLPGGPVRIHFSLDMLVMDAWSIYQVLFPDLIDLYENPRAELPPLEIGFRDYVLGRLDTLATSSRREESRRYWLDRLPTLPAAPELPLVTSPAGPVRFERVECDLPAGDWARLKAQGLTRGVTPSVLLVAVFAEALRAWSAEDRFTVNFPVSDRLSLHPQVDQLVGDFTNTLLVAVEKTDGCFEERAADIQRRLWQDLEHRHFTGVEVLRELSRQQGGALTPAMPIVVTSLLGHPARRESSALGKEVYGVSQTPQVLLDFQIREIDGVLHIKWDHLAAMFPDGLIEAMFDSFRSVLHGLLDSDDAWRAERPCALPADQTARRRRVNDTARPVRDVLLDQWLAERAAQTPSAPAVISSRHTLTWAALHQGAQRIGAALRTPGATGQGLVAVVMEKGWEQYAAVYGVLAAGAAYLPVDPALPEQRLRMLLEDCGVTTVLTQPWLADRSAWPEDVTVLTVDPLLSAFPGTAGRAPAGADRSGDRGVTDLAYVIHTSGSTGRPKGVMVDHRAVVNHVTDVAGRLGLDTGDRMMATANLHFDMSVFDVFGILATGGAAVLPEPYDVPDPASWLTLADTERVTFWAAVPQLMQLVTEQAVTTGAPALRNLRHVVLAGDWIPLDLPAAIRRLAPTVRVFGSGGPTETVNWSVLYRIGAIDPSWTSIPYGKPLANHRYHILDGGRRERPDWVPGEIVTVSEVGLAQGYWGAPDLTAERFFTMPDSGERAYATGDRGRWLPDGNIEILGRTDFQVKIHGYRIEPGEVESALIRHPRVAAAAVVAPVTPGGGRRLVGFYCEDADEPGARDGGTDPHTLGAHLRGLLPAYMVPADLRPLERMPLTANGKVDRLLLLGMAAEAADRDPDASPAGAGAGADAAVVALVAEYYAEALGLGTPQPHADFFQSGGDSLLGTRLATALGTALGIDLPLRTVFAHPTPAALCTALAEDPQYAEVMSVLAEVLAEEPDSTPDTEPDGTAALLHTVAMA